MSGQGPDSRLADRVWQALILAALLPIAVAGLGELLGWGIRGVPYGDNSIIELQILRATRGQQLLGPASRFGWNHPGPLYFYLLAPLYVLAKLQRWSLFFGTGIVNLVCGYGFLRSCFRQVRAAAVRLAVLGGFGVYLIYLNFRMVQTPPPSGLTDYWNPFVVLLPLLWMTALCVEFAAGDVKPVPYIVVLASLIVQSHVTTALYCLAAVLASAASFLKATLPSKRLAAILLERWRRLGLSAALAAAAWFPPLLEQLTQAPGNLTQIWRFARKSQIHHSLGDTLRFVSYHLVQPILHPLTPTKLYPAYDLLDVAAALAFAVLLGIALRAARRSRRSFGLRLTALTLVGLAAAFIGGFIIQDEQLGHLGTWFSVLLLLGLVGAAAALVPERSAPAADAAAGRRRPRRAVAIAQALVVIASLAGTSVVGRAYLAHASVPELRDADWPLAKAVFRQVDFRNPGIYIHIVGGESWSLAFTLAMILEKYDIPVTGDPQHRSVWGPRPLPVYRELWFSDTPLPGLVEIGAQGSDRVYADPRRW